MDSTRQINSNVINLNKVTVVGYCNRCRQPLLESKGVNPMSTEAELPPPHNTEDLPLPVANLHSPSRTPSTTFLPNVW